jgi:hypothetical protein
VGGARGTHGRGEKIVHTRFWSENLKERALLEDRGVDERKGTEWILGRLDGRMLSEFKWLRIRASGGLL